ncbi:MAG: dihydropteroate synthase [Calditrichia bacterium]
MLRLLKSLNKRDALEELAAVGLSRPSDQQIALLVNEEALCFDSSFVEVKMIASDHQLPGTWLGDGSSGWIVAKAGRLDSWLHTLKTTLPTDSRLRTLVAASLDALAQTAWRFETCNQVLDLTHTQIMGILNITPDSFSDGGLFINSDQAYAQGMRMLEEGADILDIGGESTRPGAEDISLEDEWKRIEPVIKRLSRETCLLSVDTYKSEIARRALCEGVHIVNDISGLTFDNDMPKVLREWNVPVILMHLQGTPRDMQRQPHYDHLMAELTSSLMARCNAAEAAGLTKIIIDPGIGFGKRLEDNYEIIRRLDELRVLGKPILLGTSRKSFIGNYLNVETAHRLPGTIASNLFGVLKGAAILRVHDVWEAKQSLDIWQAIHENKA